ncbi:MAG: SMC-Scp complex subunit ScpB [Nanoarchaeota archaeon]|nr:SMC-Scp complex subunit ScpB [Nanoarchaeota archaeon]
MVSAPKAQDYVRTVEAILFSYGKRVHIEELSKLCRCRQNPEIIKEALNLLKQEYDEKQNALMVIEDGDLWKLTTRERFSNVVSKIVPHTELSKTILETLAILAWKAPMRQSELIEIRTNKAYDHVNELVDSGFISKEKYGRTYILKLTQKFFDYFDLKTVEDAHKMFDKLLPEQEKKEMELRIQAAKEAVDAKELTGQLPVVEPEKNITKASLASELIEAAKHIKISQNKIPSSEQPENNAVSMSMPELQSQESETPDSSIESVNDAEEKIISEEKENDLEDEKKSITDTAEEISKPEE